MFISYNREYMKLCKCLNPMTGYDYIFNDIYIYIPVRVV